MGLILSTLAHALDGVDELAAIVEKNNLVATVAYNLRFHPSLAKAREWLASGRIGKVYSARAEISERVTDWHPWEDYCTSYTVRSDLGGGVLLTQSHELDYLAWLFGKPNWAFASGGNKGGLGIDTKDAVESVIGFPNGVDVSAHFDYVKRLGVRSLEISGTSGRIFCDLLTFTATLIPMEQGSAPVVVNPPDGFERNVMYVNELAHFLKCVRTGTKPEVTIEDGKAAMKLAFAMRESMQTGECVRLV